MPIIRFKKQQDGSFTCLKDYYNGEFSNQYSIGIIKNNQFVPSMSTPILELEEMIIITDYMRLLQTLSSIDI